MLKTIRQFFTPPVFPDNEDKTRVARVLYVLLLNILALLAVGELGVIFIFAYKVVPSIFIGTMIAGVLILRALAQRGRVQLAGVLFVSGLWAIVTLDHLLLIGEISTVFTAIHIAVAVIAGVLLGRRSSIFFAALSSIAGLGLAILENAGYPLYHYFPGAPLADWFNWALAFLLTLTPLNLTLQGSAQALAHARKSEKRYKTLFNEAPIMYLTVHDRDGAPIIMDCNVEFLEKLGYTREQVIGQPLANFYTPQSRSALLEDGGFQRALRDEVKNPVERELVAQDGRTLHALLRVAPEIEEAGKTVGVLTMYLDITERTLAEEAQKESESRFRLLAENSTDMISRHDAQGVYLYVSPACRALLGYEPEELIGHSAFEFVHPEDIPAVDQSRISIVEQPVVSTTVFRARRKGGEYIWLESMSHAVIEEEIGGIAEIHVASRDVTMRRRAEESLRESEARFRVMFEQAAMGVAQIDTITGRFVRVNRKYCELVGYSRAEMEATDFQTITHPDDLKIDLANMELLRAGEIHEFTMEKRYFRKSGDTIWVSLTVSPMWAMGEIPTHHIAVVQDITARKQTEDALRKSEERYLRITEAITDYVYTVRVEDGRIVETEHGPGCLAVTGYKADEFVDDPFLWLSMVVDEDRPLVEEQARRILAGEDLLPIEHRIIHKNGTLRWVKNTFVPHRDERNILMSYDGLIQDITERKLSEEALRESEEKFRDLFENINDGFALHKIILDENGKPMDYQFVDVNPIFAKRVGMKPEDLIDHRALELFPKTEQSWIDMFGRVAIEGLPAQFTNYSVEMDKYYETRIYCPRPGYFAGLFSDVTERIKAAEALRESEEHFHSLYDNATIGMYRTTPDGRILLSNPAGLRMLGYNFFEEIAKRDLEKGGFEPGYERSQFHERMQRDGIVTGLESAWKRKDGSTIYVRESAVAVKDSDGNTIYYDGTFEDITERKKAEEALQESAAKLETMIRVSPLAIILVDLNGIVQLWNSSAERIFGWTAQEVIGRPNPIVPATKQNEYSEWGNQIFQGKILNDQEAIRQRKDGLLIDVGVSSSPMYDGDGNIVGRMALIADITERKQAEMELRESEERFASLSESTFEGIVFSDKGIVVDCNKQLTAMLGRERTEIIGAKVSSFVAPESLEDVMAHVRSGSEEPYEHLALHKDGSKFPVEIRAKSLPYKGQMIRVTTIRDITERKQAEGQIQKQLERLNALRNIDDVIKSSNDLRFTLKVFLGEAAAQLKVDAASVFLFNKNTLTLDYVASHGFHSAILQHTKLGAGKGYAGRVIYERKTIHVPDLVKADDKQTDSFSITGENFCAYVGSPLIAKGQVVGVLEIFQRSPFTPTPEWFNFLNMLAGQAAIAVDNAQLFENLQRSNFDLTFAYDATIEGWSRAMDLRDKETEGHTQRVTSLTVKLAQKMGIPSPEIVHMRRGALLHDIGKMGVPDGILLKEGKLTPQEWDVMRQHTIYAYEMLRPIHYLEPALDIPRYHHERWDGSGYPNKLKGEDIPLSARIFAVVDVWDAVTSDRPYRSGWTKIKAIEHIKSESGKHFDPKVVEMFLPLVSHE